MIQGKKLDDSTRRAILAAIAAGERIVDVCKKFHVNRSTVQALIRAGLASPPATPPPPPPAPSLASPLESPLPGSSVPSSDLPPGAADPEALERARAAAAAAGTSPGSGGAGTTPPPNAPPPPNPLADAEFVVGLIGGLKETAVEGCISAGLFPDLPAVKAAGKLTPFAEGVLAQNAPMIAPVLRRVMGIGWVGVAIALGLDALFTYLAIRGAVVAEMRRRGDNRKDPTCAPGTPPPPPPMPRPGEINPQGPPNAGAPIDAQFVPFDPLRPPKPADIPDPTKKVA